MCSEGRPASSGFPPKVHALRNRRISFPVRRGFFLDYRLGFSGNHSHLGRGGSGSVFFTKPARKCSCWIHFKSPPFIFAAGVLADGAFMRCYLPAESSVARKDDVFHTAFSLPHPYNLRLLCELLFPPISVRCNVELPTHTTYFTAIKSL